MSVAEVSLTEVPSKANLFHHILVATDFSKPSERAFSEALVIAKENDAQIALVHVVRADWRYQMLENPGEIDLEEADAKARMRTFTNTCSPDREITSTLIRRGPTAQSVAAAAAQMGCDLLVIGTRGRGGLSKLALGSTAEELLRISPCPVMTVGPRAEITPAKNAFQTIVFATDFGKGSCAALKVAISLAQKRRAKLVLLHMATPMPVTSTSLSAYAPAGAAAEDVLEWQSSSRMKSLRQLKECLPCGIHLEQEPEFVTGTDLCPEGVLTAAERYRADLIVMGANRPMSAKMMAHIPWTAVHEVVRNSPCPVLTMAG
jgi:nucleotide-binding universal stress UspA family protein